ncbi:hypothetical protein MA16_Dca019959 [Dendrobium catenatum]|uniref:Uncharacterized protein n=1 Tax=Dendrobium catenatum TaxID=906689 RepID=A0A2I0WHB0_9ASPA|nr:hypothetical protein MA16_Dca019959 [Dendrobium catenatum]
MANRIYNSICSSIGLLVSIVKAYDHFVLRDSVIVLFAFELHKRNPFGDPQVPAAERQIFRHLLAGEGVALFTYAILLSQPKERAKGRRIVTFSKAHKMSFDWSSTTAFWSFTVFCRKKWSSPLEMP